MINVEEEAKINIYYTTFLNQRKQTIFAKYWEYPKIPKALVFIAHGFGEHCLPYDKLAKALVLNGFFVFSHDHVGHGQSSGSRAYISSFSHYIQDVFQHVNMMMEKFPEKPIFLCGHSMGGTVSILTALQKPQMFKGVVLIAPAIAANPKLVSPFKIVIIRVLGWIFPRTPIIPLNYNHVCSSGEIVKTMLEDPLRYHGSGKAGFGVCLINACEEVQNKASLVSFPFFLLQAEEDKICDIVQGNKFYEKAPVKDKLNIIYRNAYHNLLLEPNGIAEQVMEDITEWLNIRA